MDMAKVNGPLSVVNVHKFEHLGCPLIVITLVFRSF